MKDEKPPVAQHNSKPWTLRAIGGKTVWDWMGLLIVPIMLSLITVVFTWQQDARQQRTEAQRAESERKIEEQRAQDEALQAYLDQMSTLLLEKDLRGSKEDSEVRTLARARTLTVLGRLDPSRKREVLQFLDEADLIQNNEGVRLTVFEEMMQRSSNEEKGPEVEAPIISLEGADLSDTDLRGVDFDGASLSGADLSHANLEFTTIRSADLKGANLRNADLRGALLTDTALGGADLRDANLDGANLISASLFAADLKYANLSEANLVEAKLREADLYYADLSKADLEDADLYYADLEHARGATDEQLAEASSLTGATLPNGQKYEDWLKSKVSGEDEETPGPS